MYSVKINKQQHQVVFVNQNKTLAKGFFNKKPFDVNTAKIDANKYHIISENKSYLIHVLLQTEHKWEFLVNNKHYVVEAKSPFDEFLTKAGINTEKKEKYIKASMPGKVVKIEVKVGDSVKIGDSILVLEAMKMENNFKSNYEGKIKKVLVKKNDTVFKNDTLIEFE